MVIVIAREADGNIGNDQIRGLGCKNEEARITLASVFVLLMIVHLFKVEACLASWPNLISLSRMVSHV